MSIADGTDRSNRTQRRRAYNNPAASEGFSGRLGLVSNVHHAHTARLVDMRQGLGIRDWGLGIRAASALLHSVFFTCHI